MRSKHDAYWRNCFFGQKWTERRISRLVDISHGLYEKVRSALNG